ncbi:MAG: MBL fold metallo-hydrolase [Anaerovorax sp.]|nr:MBL fold metallo-hydrolase [Anaerovorax sp.]
MILKMLVENTSVFDDIYCEHGLSLYIETKNHKILFDMGASAIFSKNAEKMGVDLKDVDIAILSHGHYDHGGGLATFLKLNDKAKILLNQNAFGKYFANRQDGEKKYIGLDQNLLPNDRFVFVKDNFIIDDDMELLSNVKGQKYKPSGNKELLKEIKGSLVLDDFMHEQNLIIKEEKGMILVAGCAHNGIINILENFHQRKGCFPSLVIGGFHLYNHSCHQTENPQIVKEIGQFLKETNSTYLTCHCTGVDAFHQLKETMGEQIMYLSTGSCFSNQL